MAMKLAEWLEAIDRGETEEQYKNRKARIRRLANERSDLEDAIGVLKDYGNSRKDVERLAKKEKRLEKVVKMINQLV